MKKGFEKRQWKKAYQDDPEGPRQQKLASIRAASRANDQRQADKIQKRQQMAKDYGSPSMWGSSRIGQAFRAQRDRATAGTDLTNRGKAARAVMQGAEQERAWYRPEGSETNFSPAQEDWMQKNPNLVRHKMTKDALGRTITTGEKNPEGHAPLAASYDSGFWNRTGQFFNPFDQRSKDARMYKDIQTVSQNQADLQRSLRAQGVDPIQYLRSTDPRIVGSDRAADARTMQDLVNKSRTPQTKNIKVQGQPPARPVQPAMKTAAQLGGGETFASDVQEKHKAMLRRAAGVKAPPRMMPPGTDQQALDRFFSGTPPGQPQPHRDDELQEIKSFLNKWEQFAARDLVQEEVEPSDVDVSSFKVNKTLEPNVWQEDQTLNPTVRRRLLHIADKFWQSLDLPGLKIDDVTFTGSLANYNWSQFSDVVLHILVDFRDLPVIDVLTEALMTAKRVNWNNKHNIEIFGFEVEIYIQDSNETHHSTGVYSVLHDRWEVRPQYEDFTIDYDNVKIKAAHIMNQIDKIEKGFEAGNYEESISDVDRLKEKLRKFRKCGLEQGGEYSPENLAFKALRRNGYLAKLSKFKIDSYDKIMSL